MTLSFLTSNHSDNMIGWKIVARKNQATTTTQTSKQNSSETAQSKPYFVRLNQGAKRIPSHTNRGVWFGRKDSPVIIKQTNDEVGENYHSRVHSITTIIMLTTVFVFVTTLASAAVLVCWCKRHPDDKSSKRRKKQIFKSKLYDDFAGVKDDEEDNDEFDDDDDDDDDVETCEMREIVNLQPSHDISDDDHRSDDSDSDFIESATKTYTKLPCEEDFNRSTSLASDDKSCIREENSEDCDIAENDSNEYVDIKPSQSQSKYRLLNCIVPNLLRKLTMTPHLTDAENILEMPSDPDLQDLNHSAESCYFVSHSFAVERHFLNPPNPQSKFFDKFLSRLRLERSPKEEVFKLSRHDSNQSLL